MKILIKNGTIVDGTGQKPFQSDLLIVDDKISKIGEIHADDETLTIDAEGLIVSPGFIDTHSHSDLEVLKNPEILPKVKQGITTEFLGQDGISMAPLPKKYISPWRKNLAGLDGVSDEIDWEYETTDNYLKMIEAVGPGLNQAYLVPHGNIRMEAMGLDNREPTNEELEKMEDIVRREMDAGAFGMSTGLIYMPCAYSETNELIELNKIVKEYDGVFVTHQRSEADTIIESMEETIEIGEKSGVKTHFSHFKVCGKNNWDKVDDMMKLLDEGKEKGVEISFDQYPYIAGSTMLGVILPPWVHDGGTNKVIERLGNPELRKKMIKDIEEGIEGWDNFIGFAGFDGIFVTSVTKKENEEVVGLSLKEIADLRGTDPYNATFDLLESEENAVGMVNFYGKEEHIKKFIKRPEMNCCTDGLLSPGKPHPRLYGAFPRLISKYVREEEAISIEEAIYKLTLKPATTFGVKNRGKLAEGYFADVIVFDLNTIKDKGTWIEPNQYPEGIKHVIINGGLTIEDGKHTGNRYGRVIRKNKQ